MTGPAHDTPPQLAGRTVVVAGLGVSGAAAARVLLGLGARVLLTDAAEPPVLAGLVAAGGQWLGAVQALPDGVDLVVTSPGWRPDSPLLLDAARPGRRPPAPGHGHPRRARPRPARHPRRRTRRPRLRDGGGR
ncbi:MAG: hypothetical protein ACXVFZ_03340 [Blastococcus sp.]